MTSGKVIHITKSHNGGGGIYATRLSKALSSVSQPSVVLSVEDGSLSRFGFLDGKCSNLVDRGLSGVYSRRSRDPFHSFLRTTLWKPTENIGSHDIIHLHSITGFIGKRGLEYLLKCKPKVFWTAHNPWLFTGGCVAYNGCDSFTSGCQLCPILKPPLAHASRIEHLLKRSFLKNHQVFPIANSNWMARLMNRSPLFNHFGAIPVIPPIVDDVFTPLSDRDEIKRSMGFRDDQFIVTLSASSLTDQGKGIIEFFDSIAQFEYWAKEVTFLLIGDGRISTPPGVDVRFTGRICCPQRLAHFYAISDLLVSASKMETFGMAILEAQACGTPVIAFHTGGTPEAMAPLPTCQLISNGDYEALHGAVETAVKRGPIKPQQRKEIGKWVSERHDSRTISQHQMRIYVR